MEETTLEDVVNALIADSASRHESTSKKTSSIPSECSFTPPEEQDAPPAPSAVPMEDPSSADARLESFIIGETPLVLPDGTVMWHAMSVGKSYTLNEIAMVMGVTRERVRQIERGALKKAFASFSSMARREGDNPIDWFRQTFHEIDKNHDGTFEYDS